MVQMVFQIVGEKAGREIIDTRIVAASAAVLAMKWVAEGVERVRIKTGGRIFTVAEFRQHFLGKEKH